MKGLTKRQEEVLSYIDNFISSNRYSPSYREIQNHFGFASIGTVYDHVKVLKRKGALEGEKQSHRSLTPFKEEANNKHGHEVQIPFIGHIAAGAPIETFPQSQTLAIPDFLVRDAEKTYILRSRGDSLKDEMISDGDLLIIEAGSDALDGETVLLFVDGNISMVKQYHPEGSYVRLEGAQSGTVPITLRYEEIAVQGVVRGLLRMLQ